MVASFNEAFEKKEMSPSQKQAIITLTEKKGKDSLSYLENWRPISLINADIFGIYSVADATVALQGSLTV